MDAHKDGVFVASGALGLVALNCSCCYYGNHILVKWSQQKNLNDHDSNGVSQQGACVRAADKFRDEEETVKMFKWCKTSLAVKLNKVGMFERKK